MGGRTRLDPARLPGIRARSIPGAGWGEAAEAVDPEVAATVQIALAAQAAAKLIGDTESPGPGTTALAVRGRIARADRDDAVACERAIALHEGRWPPERRAIAAVFRARQLLRHVGVSPSVTRALCHAALTAVCTGLATAAATPAEAVKSALQRLVKTPVSDGASPGAHRLRVCSLLHAAGRQLGSTAAVSGPVAPLVLVLFIELARRPGPDGAQPGFHDLLTRAAAADHPHLSRPWLDAMVAAVGVLGIGAMALLPGGRAAMVLGPGPDGDPRRPMLLVGDRGVQPPMAVKPLPPG